MKSKNIARAFMLLYAVGVLSGFFLNKTNDMEHYTILFTIWFVGYLILTKE